MSIPVLAGLSKDSSPAFCLVCPEAMLNVVYSVQIHPQTYCIGHLPTAIQFTHSSAIPATGRWLGGF